MNSLLLLLTNKQIENDKQKPRSNNHHRRSQVNPRVGNLPTSGPLIVGSVSDSSPSLLLDESVSRPLVVQVEGENTVLVGDLERGRVHRAKVGGTGLLKSQSVVGVQHGELELDIISDKGNPLLKSIVPLSQSNSVGQVLAHLVNLLVVNIRGSSEVVSDELGGDDVLGDGNPLNHVLDELSVGGVGSVLLIGHDVTTDPGESSVVLALETHGGETLRTGDPGGALSSSILILLVLLVVVDVRSGWGGQQGNQLGVVAEVSGGTGEEHVSGVGDDRVDVGERQLVVVGTSLAEMVDELVELGGDGNAHFLGKVTDRLGCVVGGGHRENVAALVEELEELSRSEGRAESWVSNEG